MKYEIIGYERVSGEKSRKTGKPFDMRILHCKDLTPFTENNATVGGNKVEQLTIWLAGQDIDYVQRVLDLEVGDKIRVYYNRTGFIDGFDLIDN